jgi:hypothetical protein
MNTGGRLRLADRKRLHRLDFRDKLDLGIET